MHDTPVPCSRRAFGDEIDDPDTKLAYERVSYVGFSSSTQVITPQEFLLGDFGVADRLGDVFGDLDFAHHASQELHPLVGAQTLCRSAKNTRSNRSRPLPWLRRSTLPCAPLYVVPSRPTRALETLGEPGLVRLIE